MKNKIFNLITAVKTIVAIAFISFGFSSCSPDDNNTDNSTASKLSIKETFDALNRAPAPGDSSIADIAVGGGFNELVSALVYVDSELDAGLVDLFANGTDQYTVFAPTDQAFQNLYAALNVSSITELPAPLVRDVLLYHVTEGRRASNSVVPKKGTRTITTLLESQFSVTPAASINAIGNTANITTANISASNGIIHVIDTVLLPIN
ncbi:fasciclin domain-containing protein [Flavobacterium terrisoli]|uniref:fasciclin domain-containing protein n=1 Tax=Flavobacterium terrisoli TaxID=3242195 RepID=UPI00254319B7|nr:fasciclin domain-containing protein [Flavobacterium buctense]